VVAVSGDPSIDFFAEPMRNYPEQFQHFPGETELSGNLQNRIGAGQDLAILNQKNRFLYFGQGKLPAEEFSGFRLQRNIAKPALHIADNHPVDTSVTQIANPVKYDEFCLFRNHCFSLSP